MARDNGLRRIAFPAISSGVYGYPIEEATRIALDEGIKNIDEFDEIRYICFSERDYEVYRQVYGEISG